MTRANTEKATFTAKVPAHRTFQVHFMEKVPLLRGLRGSPMSKDPTRARGKHSRREKGNSMDCVTTAESGDTQPVSGH